MNRRLRRWHGRVIRGLLFLLPFGLVMAVAVRPEVPVEGAARREFGLPEPTGESLDLSGAWNSDALRSRLWRASAARPAVLELQASEDLALPDVLLYWRAQSTGADALDGTERLLGSFFGDEAIRYSLEGLPEKPGGQLLLYSLAHKQVVASASLDQVGS